MPTTDPVAEFLTAPGTPSFAHEIAPAPDGHHWFDPNQPTEDLPRDLARYHIARAYGFYLTAQDVNHCSPSTTSRRSGSGWPAPISRTPNRSPST